MDIKHLRRGLWLLLLAVLLCGCRGQIQEEPPLPTRPPLNTGPLISVPDSGTTATTQPTDPTEETQPPLSLEPVTMLSAIKWRTVPQLLSLGDGLVLACRNYYEPGKGIVNFLDLLNVYDDTVQAQVQNDAPRELVDQQFQNGYFILRDDREGCFYVYNRELKIVQQISAPNTEGYFSYNLQNYYFVDNHVLYRMDVATGNYAQMSLEYDLRFDSLAGVHPDRDIVVAKFYLSFFSENTGICAIDCRTGAILLLKGDISHLWMNGDDFYAAVTNDHVYGMDICFGNLTDGVSQKASASILGSDTVSYTMLSGSGIMLLRTVDENNLSTTVYDLGGGGISSKLAQYGYTTSTLGAVYLRQEQLILGVYPDELDFSPVVIDPKVLRYEKSLNLNKESWPALVDRTLILNYQAEVSGPVLPDQLLALRQKANELEKKFGVTILMGEQVLGFCGNTGAVESNPTAIANALTMLERELVLYPEGFHGQFRNGIREGGLYLCLTGRIDGNLDPVGSVTKNGNRYEIALDITADGLNRTLHHELWHAIEMKLSTDSFDSNQWNACNPQRFLYYGSYDSGYQTLTQWTYAQSGDNCYFVDAYSRINPREDRARLMEYVMAEDAYGLLHSPALYKKLAIMCSAIREHFDTDGWVLPYWERYL